MHSYLEEGTKTTLFFVKISEVLWFVISIYLSRSSRLEVFCDKVAAATLLKKRLWHRCFPVNFAKFLTTPFLQNTSGGCFCLDQHLNGCGTVIWKKYWEAELFKLEDWKMAKLVIALLLLILKVILVVVKNQRQPSTRII